LCTDTNIENALCEKRKYQLEQWQHFYETVPGGDTYCTCAWEEDKLVGYSAIIPQEMVDAENNVITYGISVSTMVLPEYRLLGDTFTKLLELQKEIADREGYSFILSFPNKNAYLPVVHLAGFRLIDEGYLTKGKLIDSNYSNFWNSQLSCPFFTREAASWRMKKEEYRTKGSFVQKKYAGKWQNIDIIKQIVDSEMQDEIVFPVWKSSGCAEYKPLDDYRLRLCAYELNDKFCVNNIRRSVLLSDVF